MIRTAKLEFCCGVLFVASLIFVRDISGLEWKNKYSHLHFNLASFPNTMLINEAIVSEETNAPTITSCSQFCAKREQHSLYYNYNTAICYCNNDFDTRLDTDGATDDDSSEIMYGYISASLSVSANTSTLKYDVQPYKEDCVALYSHGYRTNAVYTVQPTGEHMLDTFCDMDTLDRALNVGADDCLHWLQLGYIEDGVYNIRLSNGTTVRAWCDQTGGGWTVIQRRQDGSVDFYRTWAEYVNGFGDAEGEYWLGLEAIYLLAEQPSSLRIDMEPFADRTPLLVYALYEDFSLASVSDKYRLSIGTFTGNCGDSLDYHNNGQFSTQDSDNDIISDQNCAAIYKGGWWYNGCHSCNLNGLYLSGTYTSSSPIGMDWYECWNYYYSMKTCSMGIKRIKRM